MSPQKKKKKTTKKVFRAPDHRDIVKLATKLVSAQIAANSQYQASMQLMEEIKLLGSDIVDSITDVLRDEKDTTQKSMLDAVAATLITSRRRRCRMSQTKLLEPLSHPHLDRLFQSAMRRAFVMLNAPFDTERIVFAEQIFSHSELLTEGAIRARFTEFGWPGLKSGTPVIKLMQDVNYWFTHHLKDLKETGQSVEGKESVSPSDPAIPIEIRIEAETAKLSWLLQQTSQLDSLAPDTLSSYGDLKKALSKFNNTRDGLDIGDAFLSMDASQRNNMILLMFGGMGPREVEAMDEANVQDEPSEATGADKLPPREYRAWAIFRYLRRYGGESDSDLGSSLNNRLRVKRSELDSDRVPDVPGVEPREFHFGPLYGEVEDWLEGMEAEGGFSDIATNSDILQLHGLDPEDALGGASEFESRSSESGDDVPEF